MDRVKLDIKDKKILSIIDMNARASNTKIGNDVGLSRKSVEYRIKKLEKNGVIRGYFPKINYLGLGYDIYRIYIRLANIDPLIEKKIINFCQKSTNFYWLHPYRGKFDIGFGTISSNEIQFRKFYESFMQEFGSNITDKYITKAAEIYFFEHGYIHGGMMALNSCILERNLLLDDIDKKILLCLIRNPQITAYDIGATVGITGMAVAQRIKKMERKKVILAFRTVIDYFKLGFSLYKVFINMENPKSDKKKLLNFMREQKEILYATIPIGSYDIECEMIIDAAGRFYEIMNLMRNTIGILNFDFIMAESLLKVQPNSVFNV